MKNMSDLCEARGHQYMFRIMLPNSPVCDMNMRFVYILTSWKGSAANSRVLRDVINRENGLKVPRGNYYICDNGYANCEGFLTPYNALDII
ncbi:hypothetical protein ACS0TY_020680 [Phlomoides rotata]